MSRGVIQSKLIFQQMLLEKVCQTQSIHRVRKILQKEINSKSVLHSCPEI